MDHYNIFRLCKAVYGYIQVTTDKMKKDNLIRYQIIDLSITKNAVDTLYKDTEDYLHAENIVFLLETLKVAVDAVTRNFQILSASRRCPYELTREMGIIMWTMTKFNCPELTELGTIFMAKYGLTKHSFTSLPGRGTLQGEPKKIADIVINADIQRMFGPIYTPLLRPAFERVFTTLQALYSRKGYMMPDELARQIAMEHSPEYAKKVTQEKMEASKKISESQKNSDIGGGNSTPPLPSPTTQNISETGKKNAVTSPITSDGVRAKKSTTIAIQTPASTPATPIASASASSSSSQGQSTTASRKQSSTGLFGMFRRSSVSGGGGGHQGNTSPTLQAMAAPARALSPTMKAELDGMTSAILAMGTPAKERTLSEGFPLRLSDDACPLDFGLSSHKAPIEKDLRATFTLMNPTTDRYDVWIKHPFRDKLKHKFELAFSLEAPDGTPNPAAGGGGEDSAGDGDGFYLAMEPSGAVQVSVRAKFLCTANVHTEFLIQVLCEHKKMVHASARVPIELGSQLSIKLDKDEIVKSKMIGEGSYGRVYRGKYRGQDVAIKELIDTVNPDTITDFVHEVDIMKELRHNAIVSLVGAVFTPEYYSILTEFCMYGSLDSAIEKFPEKFGLKLKVKCLYDCACGMNFLHQSGIIHRDLKPENILVVSLDPASNVACKISDFGTTRDLALGSGSMTKTKGVGTPIYMAPEILDGYSKYTGAVDVYSFGLTMYSVFEEKVPYSDVSYSTPWEFAKMVVSGSRPGISEKTPNDMIGLIKSCWNSESSLRPTFDDIEECIRVYLETLKN